MKKLLMLFMFLAACAEKAIETPLPTIPQEPVPMCNYLFNSWEIVKEQGYEGLYFLIAEKEALIFVMDSEAGLHELGHFVDAERDYPSWTQAFKDAVDEYLANPNPKDPDLQDSFTFWLDVGRDMDDLYAELYKISLIGELPAIFEEFYVR